MNIIRIEDFNKVDDPVMTEECIHYQLVRGAPDIDVGYSYASLPIAWSINKRGVATTQQIISEVFHGNLVFTPHATILDSYMSIPHYACNYNVKLSKPWNERKYKFSFMGSFLTHPVRRKIYEVLKNRNDCFVIDTGPWHFEVGQRRQEQNREKYIEILGDTKYSLCPRGTGPSTIRIWEAMAMGSCPIILSDFLKMPLRTELDENLWIKMLQSSQEYDILIEKREEYNNEDYYRLFSNDNLYKSIVKNLF